MNRNNDNPRDEVKELLAQAGPPPPIPAEDLASIRAAARAEWNGLRTDQPAATTNYRPLLALAASLLIAVALAWLWTTWRAPTVHQVVATVELVRGDSILATPASGAPQSPIAGDEITSGASLETSTGRVAIRLTGGHSIRFDAGTEASVVSATRVELRRGAVYVDSGPGSGSNVEIATPFGLVTEIGTQFEVRLGSDNGETVWVRVREGSVSLAHDGESYSAAIGQQLTVDSRGEVFRSNVPVRGPVWAWAIDTAPGIDMEGRPLPTYLEWLARETGWEIQYADANLEKAVAGITLHASTRGHTPEESLDAVMPATGGLTYELRDNTLVIAGSSGR